MFASKNIYLYSSFFSLFLLKRLVYSDAFNHCPRIVRSVPIYSINNIIICKHDTATAVLFRVVISLVYNLVTIVNFLVSQSRRPSRLFFFFFWKTYDIYCTKIIDYYETNNNNNNKLTIHYIRRFLLYYSENACTRRT